MINISEIVATWPVIDGWSISPGVGWCEKGNRVVVGDRCVLGYESRIESDVVVGYDTRIGRGLSVGRGVRIGKLCSIGDGAMLYENVSLGNGVTIGDYSYVKDNAIIHNAVNIGSHVHIGHGSRVRSGVTLGDGCSIMDVCTEVSFLGYGPRGYAIVVALESGVPKFGAGCRWFTFDEARKYWGPEYEGTGDTVFMQAMITAAERIALKWAEDEPSSRSPSDG